MSEPITIIKLVFTDNRSNTSLMTAYYDISWRKSAQVEKIGAYVRKMAFSNYVLNQIKCGAQAIATERTSTEVG